MDAFGKLLPPETLILRTAAGTADMKDGSASYELSNCIDGSPIIRNEQTGRWWVMNWQQLLTLARAAGVDTPAEPGPEAPDAA